MAENYPQMCYDKDQHVLHLTCGHLLISCLKVFYKFGVTAFSISKYSVHLS